MRFRIRFKEAVLFPKGCITCGRENPYVEHYQDRYCCELCLKYLQTKHGHLVKLRALNDRNSIAADAFRDGAIDRNCKVDIDDLRIFGYKCYATYAGEKGEMIVLLYDQDFGAKNLYLESTFM